MKRTILIITLISVMILSTGCSRSMSLLKAGPAPDSGFLGSLSEQTAKNENYPFHRVYHPEETRKDVAGVRKVHVAPITLKYVKNESIYYRDEEKAKDSIKEDAQEIAEYARKAFAEHFEKDAPGHFLVIEEEEEDALVLEVAIVELTPTDVVRNTVGTALGYFVPGGGLVAIKGQGYIAIEAVLRDKQSGKALLAFSDRESGKFAPINLMDFSFYSHAREAIDEWAEQVTEILSADGTVKVADSLPITLLPL